MSGLTAFDYITLYMTIWLPERNTEMYWNTDIQEASCVDTLRHSSNASVTATCDTKLLAAYQQITATQHYRPAKRLHPMQQQEAYMLKLSRSQGSRRVRSLICQRTAGCHFSQRHRLRHHCSDPISNWIYRWYWMPSMNRKTLLAISTSRSTTWQIVSWCWECLIDRRDAWVWNRNTMPK